MSVDGFPQDGGLHLMDIYATTNPEGSGTYYWLTAEWTFDDMVSDMGREILVIPYGDACKQLPAATPCILTIDVNVTGLDVYNVMITTSYIPEVCQAEMACDMGWADPKKKCCLYDAYQRGDLEASCVSALDSQAASNPFGVIGSSSTCIPAPEKNSSNAVVITLIVVFSSVSLVFLSCLIWRCRRVLKVSEARRRLANTLFGQRKNGPGR